MKPLAAPVALSTAGFICAALLVAPGAAAGAEGAARAIPGGQSNGDSLFPHQGNTGYDVRDYDLSIAYTAEGSIDAVAALTSTTTGRALSEFSLDLEGLTVRGVTVDGVRATYRRVTERASSTYKLVVTPATPVDGTFTTVVTYGGTPRSHTDPDGSLEGWTRTAGGDVVALNEPVGAMTWFPTNNTPRDKATFTTRLTVPYAEVPLPGQAANQTAVSNGVLADVGTDPGAGTRTFTWRQDNQQAPYLALVAIGDFDVAESVVALSDGTTPEWSYLNPRLTGSGFEESRDQLSPILRALEGHYGAYPGVSTGLVVDSSTLGYALESQDRPYFESSIDRNTLIHELSHQWFGNAVSPTDWSDIWLNEGPATWIATQIEAQLYDGPSTRDAYYGEWEAKPADSRFWRTPVAGFDDPADLFGSPTYERGAMTLEALRAKVGARDFAETMATWIERHDGGDASTADWIALSEEVSGRDLSAFFDDWLYDTDKPAWPGRLQTQIERTRPRILGTPRVGRTLRAVVDRDRGTTTRFQWYDGATAIRPATTRRFVVTRAQVGDRLRVRTTTSRPGFVKVVTFSKPSRRVAGR